MKYSVVLLETILSAVVIEESKATAVSVKVRQGSPHKATLWGITLVRHHEQAVPKHNHNPQRPLYPARQAGGSHRRGTLSHCKLNKTTLSYL